MNILAELKNRFRDVLAEVSGETDVQNLLDMIKPAQDARFGDYQANCAMPLGNASGNLREKSLRRFPTKSAWMICVVKRTSLVLVSSILRLTISGLPLR